MDRFSRLTHVVLTTYAAWVSHTRLGVPLTDVAYQLALVDNASRAFGIRVAAWAERHA